VSAVVAAAFAEQRRTLHQLLLGHLPAPRANHIATLVRDAIAIVPRAARRADAAIGASRLGGQPDLPPGTTWPTAPGGAVDFVAQLRLEQLAELDIHHRLPPRGLLSFFHAYRTDGVYELEARVFYYPDVAGFVPLRPPGRRGKPAPIGIDFAPRALLPPHSSQLVPRPGAADAYAEVYDEVYRTHGDAPERFHGLFGFDRPFEDEQRADEDLLLRIDEDAAPYDFVEAVCAYYFVSHDELGHGELAPGPLRTARMHEGAQY
jgi:hypothetical protein